MTGDAGNVTHDPSHAYIMKKVLADIKSGTEGDRYCRFQSWPPGPNETNAISGK